MRTGDFGVEWENDAEGMLADMEFHSEDTADEIGDSNYCCPG